MEIEVEQEFDGRWIAEIPAIPGAMAYGCSCDDALDKVKALALRVLADKMEHGEVVDEAVEEFFAVTA